MLMTSYILNKNCVISIHKQEWEGGISCTINDSMETSVYWPGEHMKGGCKLFLQTSAHASRNLVDTSVSDLFRALSSLFLSSQFKVFLCQIPGSNGEQVCLNYRI